MKFMIALRSTTSKCQITGNFKLFSFWLSFFPLPTFNLNSSLYEISFTWKSFPRGIDKEFLYRDIRFSGKENNWYYMHSDLKQSSYSQLYKGRTSRTERIHTYLSLVYSTPPKWDYPSKNIESDPKETLYQGMQVGLVRYGPPRKTTTCLWAQPNNLNKFAACVSVSRYLIHIFMKMTLSSPSARIVWRICKFILLSDTSMGNGMANFKLH